jgi:hypothetical protein
MLSPNDVMVHKLLLQGLQFGSIKVLLQGITAAVRSGQCVAAGVHAMVTTCHFALHSVLLQGFVSRVCVKGYNISRVTTCQWVVHRVFLQGFVSRVIACQGLQHVQQKLCRKWNG